MAVIYSQEGEVAIIRHTFSGNATKIRAGYNEAARWLWDRGYGDHGTEILPILWSDLSNQDKLDLVHGAILLEIKKWGRNQMVLDGERSGRSSGSDQFEQTVEINDG
jgi:hypothetical protein